MEYKAKHRKPDNERRYPETTNSDTKENKILKPRTRIPGYLIAEHRKAK